MGLLYFYHEKWKRLKKEVSENQSNMILFLAAALSL
jgi:hypothetical protein